MIYSVKFKEKGQFLKTSCLYVNTNKDIFKNYAREPSLVSDSWAAGATGSVTKCKAQSQTKQELILWGRYEKFEYNGVFQLSCLPGHCRTSEELKYTMTRLAMDGVDLFIVEHGCAANIKVVGRKH